MECLCIIKLSRLHSIKGCIEVFERSGSQTITWASELPALGFQFGNNHYNYSYWSQFLVNRHVSRPERIPALPASSRPPLATHLIPLQTASVGLTRSRSLHPGTLMAQNLPAVIPPSVHRDTTEGHAPRLATSLQHFNPWALPTARGAAALPASLASPRGAPRPELLTHLTPGPLPASRPLHGGGAGAGAGRAGGRPPPLLGNGEGRAAAPPPCRGPGAAVSCRPWLLSRRERIAITVSILIT